MARLILEENGEQRRFKLNEGRLTIGSGEAAKLRLASEDVAEVHAELEYHKGTAVLRVRKGVVPATVRGRRVAGEETLAHGVPVRIGGATITVEYDEEPSLVDRRARQGRAEKAAAGAVDAGDPGSRPLVQRQRRTVRRSAPTWLILLVFAIVATGAVWFFNKSVTQTAADSFSPLASKQRIEELLNQHSDFSSALEELERVEHHWNQLGQPERELFTRLRTEAESRLESAELVTNHQAGTTYLEQQLRRFERERLRGAELESKKVRVFLLRARQFEQTWPTHPDIDWVRRAVARYSQVVDLSQPPSFDDIAYEVETLTWAKPREYRQAFQTVERFMQTAAPEDQDRALALIDDLHAGQAEHFEDRMQQAKYHWNLGQTAEAVGELASIVMRFQDEEMEAQAARELIQLPGIDDFLRGYKKYQPHHWPRLIANPVIRRKVQELNLL